MANLQNTGTICLRLRGVSFHTPAFVTIQALKQTQDDNVHLNKQAMRFNKAAG